MMRTAPRPFGTPPTRLHAGRILLTLVALAGLVFGAWIWAFRKGAGDSKAVTESSTPAGWTAAQMHYDKPEVKAEAPAPKPIDTTAAELAKLRAMMLAMQAELEALKNRKPPAPQVVTKEAPKPEPAKKAPAPMLFVTHEIKEGAVKANVAEYVLAPGGKIPCVLETSINSDVPGFFTSKVSTNVWDTATGRHLLIPQGSTILGHDQSNQLIYGSERMDTVSLTLSLPDGRSVDLGRAPVTDQQGVAGLTGDIDRHFWRIFGAVFIGGALKGGMTALQVSAANAAGAGQVAAGVASLGNQATSTLIQPYINTRPTIRVDAGQLCNVLITKPLVLQAMWQ